MEKRRRSRRWQESFAAEAAYKAACTRAMRGRAPRDRTGFFVYSSQGPWPLRGFHAQRCLCDGIDERLIYLRGVPRGIYLTTQRNLNGLLPLIGSNFPVILRQMYIYRGSERFLN